MADEAVVRIVLDEGSSAQQTSRPQPPPPAATALVSSAPPKMSPVDVRSIESYREMRRAINSATKDADAFNKSIEGMQGELFKLRHGIDPRSISEVFSKGTAAAQDLINELRDIDKLLEKGHIGPQERIQLARAALQRSANADVNVPSQAVANTDWMKSLIDPSMQGPGFNPHVLIEGQSGSGKSMATRHLAMQRMARGEEVHVVDSHNPESWGGAKQVFQGSSGGADAAKFMFEALKSRKEEASAAKLRGELPDFKPMTIVLSDFARLMRDTPQLRDEFKTLLTEARKFRISIVADTTELTGAASGIKGIRDVLQNFGQKVKFQAPTATEGRKALMGGESFDVPQLPDYAEKRDYGLVKSAEQTSTAGDVGPAAAARRKFEKKKYDEEVAKEYDKLVPPDPPKPDQTALDVAKKRVEAEKFRAEVDAEYKKLKPQDQKSALDEFLDTAESLRGTIGGTFGRITGIVLDLSAAMRATRGKIDAVPAGGAPKTATQMPAGLVELDRNSPFKQAAPPATAGQAATAGAEASAGGAAAGGVGGMMAAAGPIGAVVAAAMAVRQMMFDAVKGAVQGAGNLAKSVTSPDEDPSKVVAGVGEAISGLGDKMPFAVGLPLIIAGEVGKVVGGLMDNFNKMAEKYGNYDAQIAMAQGQAEMTTEMANMRRAQESGGELAKFVKEQSDMQQNFEELKMAIWKQILPIMNALMKAINQILGIAVRSEQDRGDFVDPTSIILDRQAVQDANRGATGGEVRPISAL